MQSEKMYAAFGHLLPPDMALHLPRTEGQA